VAVIFAVPLLQIIVVSGTVNLGLLGRIVATLEKFVPFLSVAVTVRNKVSFNRVTTCVGVFIEALLVQLYVYGGQPPVALALINTGTL
jgi:hypothetical protein